METVCRGASADEETTVERLERLLDDGEAGSSALVLSLPCTLHRFCACIAMSVASVLPLGHVRAVRY